MHMRKFKTIISNDYKNFFSKGNIISFAAFGLVLLLFIHLDMIYYKSIIESKKPFQENQQDKTKLYIYYDQYGGHGIQLKYIPSPMCIINSDSILNESLSGVNVGEKLNIHRPLKYRDLYLENSDYKGFSGIIFIFACLFGLIGGFELTKRPHYLRVLSRIKSSPRIFFVLVSSKIFFLIFTFSLLIGICLLWLSINGINLFNNL
jgi:hypothetical protein